MKKLGLLFSAALFLVACDSGTPSNLLEKALDKSQGNHESWNKLIEEGGLDRNNNWYGLSVNEVQTTKNRDTGLLKNIILSIPRNTKSSDIRRVLNDICDTTDSDWETRVVNSVASGEAENETCSVSYAALSKNNHIVMISYKGNK